jgi:hypothetical protein
VDSPAVARIEQSLMATASMRSVAMAGTDGSRGLLASGASVRKPGFT